MSPTEKKELLKNFMEEMFDIKSMIKVGFFKKNEDYEGHAKRVCDFFGFETVYEYGALEGRAHITYSPGKRPEGEPFVTEFENIYT